MPLKVGHHRHASETPLKWPTIECWFGSFVIFRGSGSILLGNPIFFVIFRGGGGGPPVPPSGSAHVPPTAKVIRRGGHGLKSHPTDW